MELPVINVKKRSRSTDDGAARPRWQRLALLTAVIAATGLRGGRLSEAPPAAAAASIRTG